MITGPQRAVAEAAGANAPCTLPVLKPPVAAAEPAGADIARAVAGVGAGFAEAAVL